MNTPRVGSTITVTMLNGRKVTGAVTDVCGDMVELEPCSGVSPGRVKKYLMIVVEPDGKGGYCEARPEPGCRSLVSMEVFDPNG